MPVEEDPPAIGTRIIVVTKTFRRLGPQDYLPK